MRYLISRELLLGVKGRLYSACMCSVTLYVIETLLVKEDGVIGLEEVMEGCAIFGQMIGFVLWNLGIDCN